MMRKAHDMEYKTRRFQHCQRIHLALLQRYEMQKDKSAANGAILNQYKPLVS